MMSWWHPWWCHGDIRDAACHIVTSVMMSWWRNNVRDDVIVTSGMMSWWHPGCCMSHRTNVRDDVIVTSVMQLYEASWPSLGNVSRLPSIAAFSFVKHKLPVAGVLHHFKQHFGIHEHQLPLADPVIMWVWLCCSSILFSLCSENTAACKVCLGKKAEMWFNDSWILSSQHENRMYRVATQQVGCDSKWENQEIKKY